MAALGALAAVAAGCSLISLKSPEKPLSPRDLEARILTREYSAHFIGSVEQAADQIAATSQDPEVRLNALRWKIAAAAKSQRAAGQMAPMMGLLDTWALSVQMSEYLASGSGRTLFGPQQNLAVKAAADLAGGAEDMARRLTQPDEFQKDEQFIDGYARAYPIEDLHFTRASVVELWSREAGANTKLVDSLGTVPEALADAGDRLRMYGDTGPEELLWQAELATQQSGLSGADLQAALRRLDERITHLYALADATPKMMSGVVRDASTRFDSSWEQVMRDVRDEGATLSGQLSAEREAAINALDTERAAAAVNAAQIASQVVQETGDQVRRLVREALTLIIVLLLAVLALPFAAGYLVGRARRRTLAADT
ncbi:MAG: hypothetical protein WBF89_17390 [Steroidobacteraceae bacterium]